MNRRNFIGGLLTAAAGFSILPGATLYTRQWKAVTPPELTYWTMGVRLRTWTSPEYKRAFMAYERAVTALKERPPRGKVDVITFCNPIRDEYGPIIDLRTRQVYV